MLWCSGCYSLEYINHQYTKSRLFSILWNSQFSFSIHFSTLIKLQLQNHDKWNKAFRGKNSIELQIVHLRDLINYLHEDFQSKYYSHVTYTLLVWHTMMFSAHKNDVCGCGWTIWTVINWISMNENWPVSPIQAILSINFSANCIVASSRTIS